MRTDLPEGTVTLVLADIDGSVRHREPEREWMSAATRRIDGLVDATLRRHSGARQAEQGVGDAFVAAFSRASDAVGFAVELQIALAAEDWSAGVAPRLRMGVHTGEVELRDGTYTGPEIDRCARVRDLGGGGQILVTQATSDLVLDRLPEGAALRDLGVHALRGIARPERIHQVLHPDLADDPARLPDRDLERLPSPLTSFIGRDAALEELGSQLRGCRVLTLTGAGGSGKTRLALECARRARHQFEAGAWWVDLSATTTGELLAADVARALGVAANAAAPVADTLVDHLRDRQVLLVLDNCEHLVPACAALIDQLVSACADLTVLATSREPLGVVGEVGWPLASMLLPPESGSAGELTATEAGQLFVDRATRVRPNFRVTEDNAPAIATICRRLDGIPLAIELAAARVRTLAPDQILASLDDRFRLLIGGPRTAMPRQRTLEASVEWSFALLTPSERLLLARLSVFTGSFELDVAEVVCSDDSTLSVGQVLDTLARLVERSMVTFDDAAGRGRYALLETVRVYARGKLAELDEPERVRARHLDAHIEVAQQLGLAQSASVDTALAAFDAALPNLRAAMDWATSSGRSLAVLQVIGSTFDLWLVRGLYPEATARLRSGLSSGELTASERGRGLADASMMTLMAGDYDGSFDFARASVDIADQHDEAGVHARSHAYRAWSGFHSGRGTTAQVSHDLDRARELADAAGDPLLHTRVKMLAGWVEACSRSVPRGRTLLEDALRGSQELATLNFEISIRAWLASTCTFDGDADAALAHAREAVRLGRALGYDAFVVQALTTLGNVASLSGDLDAARHHFADAIGLAETDLTTLAPFALGARAQHALAEAMLGSTEDAANLVDHAERLMRGVQFGTGGSSFVLLARSLVSYRSGDRTAAGAHLAEVRASSSDPLATFPFAFASVWLARIALDEHRTEEAWELAHEALDAAHQTGTRVLVPVALETVAAVAVRTARESLAARVLGAASRVRAERVVFDPPLDQTQRDGTSTQARAELGDEEFDSLWAEGMDQADDELIAYVRRGRGSRGRPAIGWDSLTPAECEVVDLVVEGCTNQEIADRLFVSVNTVRTHLSHVYTKLGLSNRTALAARATRRTT